MHAPVHFNFESTFRTADDLLVVFRDLKKAADKLTTTAYCPVV